MRDLAKMCSLIRDIRKCSAFCSPGIHNVAMPARVRSAEWHERSAFTWITAWCLVSSLHEAHYGYSGRVGGCSLICPSSRPSTSSNTVEASNSSPTSWNVQYPSKRQRRAVRGACVTGVAFRFVQSPHPCMATVVSHFTPKPYHLRGAAFTKLNREPR